MMNREVPASSGHTDFGTEEFYWDPAAPEQSLQRALIDPDADIARAAVELERTSLELSLAQRSR